MIRVNRDKWTKGSCLEIASREQSFRTASRDQSFGTARGKRGEVMFLTVKAIHAFDHTLNNSNLLAFQYKCDTLSLLAFLSNYVISKDIQFTLDALYHPYDLIAQ